MVTARKKLSLYEDLACNDLFNNRFYKVNYTLLRITIINILGLWRHVMPFYYDLMSIRSSAIPSTPTLRLYICVCVNTRKMQ
jgi:hypothetical protein